MTVIVDIRRWTDAHHDALAHIIRHLDPLDREEIGGIWGDAPDATLINAVESYFPDGFLEGFIAVRGDAPVAIALAVKGRMPRCADLMLIGGVGAQRSAPAIYDELERRSREFGRRHGVLFAEVCVYDAHRAVLRRLRRTGARYAYSFGPIGLQGQTYVHAHWRWSLNGLLETQAA